MKQLLSEILNSWWSNPLPIIKQREVDLLKYFDPQVKKIISVIGFRRVGKTFTLFDFAHKYGKDNCVYLNFEDERLPKKIDTLTLLIDVLTEIKGGKPFVLLMDEIQEIPEWSMWARRINETTPHRLILSGSSSKLTSAEIPTELRGQTVTIPLFPLNWKEFLRFKNVEKGMLPKPRLLNLLREYLLYGGLPEIVLAQEGLRPLILSNYYNTFVNRDIVDRYKLRNREAFTDLLRLLPNTREYTYSKLAHTLKSMGHSVSKSTVVRYMSWLMGSFFLTSLEQFSQSVKQRIQTPKKAYLIDAYFTSQFGSPASANLGHLMEQAVFHKLNMRALWDPRHEIFYWEDFQRNEVDFVNLFNKSPKDLVQVTFAQNLVEIAEREVKSLVKAAKSLKITSGTVVTWDVESTKTYGTLTVSYVPLWKWLET